MKTMTIVLFYCVGLVLAKLALVVGALALAFVLAGWKGLLIAAAFFACGFAVARELDI